MRVFDSFPQGSQVCPICGNKDNQQTLLVPIHATELDGNVEAVPTHLLCVLEKIEYSPEHSIMGLKAGEGVYSTSQV